MPTLSPCFAQSSKPAARMLLTNFLKTRRAALRPADVGLPVGSSLRRTPGLRRSEVAQLAGISTEWYTLFEMGRDRAMTERVIEPVAHALRLTQAEREYVYDLVRAEPPPKPTVGHLPAICSLLEDDQKLVIVYDRWLNAIHWNVAAGTLLALDTADARDVNMLWRLFQVRGLRERFPEWEERALFFLALFRRALGRDPASPEAHSLIASLESSEDFVTMWERHEVRSLDDEARVLARRPLQLRSEFGDFTYFTIGLEVPASAGGHIRIAIPTDESGRAILRNVTSLRSLRSA